MITLKIEVPPGNVTVDRTFNPNLPKRFSGEVSVLGIPGSWQGEVTVWLEDLVGTRLIEWKMRPDFYGNYWVDTTLPDVVGDYTLKARWDKKTLIDRYDDAVPILFSVLVEAPVGTAIEASLDRTSVGVGSTVKATCYVSVNGVGQAGVSVKFTTTFPDATQRPAVRATNSQGLAEDFINATQAGTYTVLVEVPQYPWLTTLTFAAVAGVPPTKPPSVGWLDRVKGLLVPGAIVLGGLLVVSSLWPRRGR